MYPPGKFEAKNYLFCFIHGGPQDADGITLKLTGTSGSSGSDPAVAGLRAELPRLNWLRRQIRAADCAGDRFEAGSRHSDCVTRCQRRHRRSERLAWALQLCAT